MRKVGPVCMSKNIVAPPVLARTSLACSSAYFVVNCRTVSISDTLLMIFLFLSSYSVGMRAVGFQSIVRMARFCSSLPISNMPGSGNSLCRISVSLSSTAECSLYSLLLAERGNISALTTQALRPTSNGEWMASKDGDKSAEHDIALITRGGQ